jgi:hypothetical protein
MTTVKNRVSPETLCSMKLITLLNHILPSVIFVLFLLIKIPYHIAETFVSLCPFNF